MSASIPPPPGDSKFKLPEEEFNLVDEFGLPETREELERLSVEELRLIVKGREHEQAIEAEYKALDVRDTDPRRIVNWGSALATFGGLAATLLFPPIGAIGLAFSAFGIVFMGLSIWLDKQDELAAKARIATRRARLQDVRSALQVERRTNRNQRRGDDGGELPPVSQDDPHGPVPMPMKQRQSPG